LGLPTAIVQVGEEKSGRQVRPLFYLAPIASAYRSHNAVTDATKHSCSTH